ncbi:hypothetical protein HMPREF1210_02369 [Paenisporosarcina sp. HGH0030]|uniref:hypothetical protein n=1 Tax=Paenisporosarcina sp. HGH0030 TaxID=1078085 RepID=UPI00034E3301|nr:hypothetical protein [Paenisporosarcina sp. HGH0030]EPD50861.1 hypothetical protein HMPREF1210_02369 [Paenisporosarcina sp. HGH0030]
MRKQKLLSRLDEIGQSLESTGGALLLFGLGSVGIELERLDDYSDLDFFVIARPELKSRFIDRLDWLETVYPLAFSFKNTKDGHKILFEDGIYAEFAIFEEKEMDHISFSEGRIVWQEAHFINKGLHIPIVQNVSLKKDHSLNYSLNEALTNLYVGLCRYARGEKLSALKFVQGEAIDNILNVLHLIEPEVEYFPDVFNNERRLEKRFPRFAQTIGDMMQGYHHVPESALHILKYLEDVFPINQRMGEEIRRLANLCVAE